MKEISEKKEIKEKTTINNKEINNYGISDTVCHIIINKIISKVISKSNNDVIESKMNKHCFDFILNCIDQFLSTDFIFYENNNQEQDQNKNIYYSTIPQNILNTWVEIEEPETPEIDRYHYIRTKIVKESDTKKNNNDAIELVSKENQEKSLAVRSVHRSGNKLNTLKENLEFEYHFNSYNDFSDAQIKIIEENEKNLNEKEIKKKLNFNNFEKEGGKKDTKNLFIDLPCYDLPSEAYENKYIIMNSSEEYNLLRMEKEKDILNKEQQKILEKMKNKKDYEKKLKIKLTKEFDSNKVTFDSNGNIINLNIPSIDSFTNDFYMSKPIVTDLKIKNTIPYNYGKEIEEKLSNKTITLLKQNSADIASFDNNKFKANIIKNNILNKGQILEKKLSQKINIISKFKIVNPSISLNSITNQKKQKIKIEFNPLIEEEKKKNLKIKLIPSGSNFDRIIPEVGVVIQNDNKNQIKKGGFEYYNKYNKPSIKEFSQLVDQTLKLNQQLISSTLTTENTIKNKQILNKNFNTEQSDYNGYNNEFIETNNPLIQNAVEQLSNIKYNNKYNDKSLIKNKSYLGYNNSDINKYKMIFKSFDDKINKKSKNLLNTIKLTKKSLIPNLYSFLSNQDNIEENKNKNIFKSLKKRSFSNIYGSTKEIINNNNFYNLAPLKRKQYSSINNNDLPNLIKNTNNNNIELLGEEFLDNFNSKIMKNNNWGNYNFSDKNINQNIKNMFRKPVKLNKFNEYKEIIGTRKRVPHIMNTINYEKNKNIL